MQLQARVSCQELWWAHTRTHTIPGVDLSSAVNYFLHRLHKHSVFTTHEDSRGRGELHYAVTLRCQRACSNTLVYSPTNVAGVSSKRMLATWYDGDGLNTSSVQAFAMFSCLLEVVGRSHRSRHGYTRHGFLLLNKSCTTHLWIEEGLAIHIYVEPCLLFQNPITTYNVMFKLLEIYLFKMNNRERNFSNTSVKCTVSDNCYFKILFLWYQHYIILYFNILTAQMLMDHNLPIWFDR